MRAKPNQSNSFMDLALASELIAVADETRALAKRVIRASHEKLKTQQTAHLAALEGIKQAHSAEIAEMKASHAAELKKAKSDGSEEVANERARALTAGWDTVEILRKTLSDTRWIASKAHTDRVE